MRNRPGTITDAFFRGLAGACDRVVLALAPERGARRIAVRKLFAAAERQFAAYEGAAASNTRDGKWLGSRLSADSGLELDLATLRSRSQELSRNDSVGGAVDDRVNHVVSTGYRPQAKIKGDDEKPNKPLNAKLEKKFARWAKHAARNGKMSLWGILRLAERCHAVDGEAFVVMSDLGRADKPVPLALEVVAAERVETPPQHLGNPRVRLGIEYDAAKQIVAYWIRRTHPDDTLEVDHEYDRIAAWRVCHLFEPWFAGQSRGLPWMTRTLNRIKDGKDVDEATILAMQVEACFAAFIEGDSNPIEAAINAANGTTDAAGNRLEDITPGTIKRLYRGQKMTFGAPNRPGNSFAPFMEWNQRRIAAALNYPVEMLTKNWSGTSFAGGRLALTNARMQFWVGQCQLMEQLLAPIWNRFVDECVILGIVEEIDARQYEDDPEPWQEHCWIAPAWPYALNPGEEVDATIKEVQGNLKTHRQALAERGLDYDEVMEGREQERADEIERDVVPPTPNGNAPLPAVDPASETNEPELAGAEA
jgi:lambda family phage portal protein